MISMAEEARIEVWDIAVGVFHWSLVVFFFVAYSSGDDENRLHVYAGYGVSALVAFRILWGLVGTKHARFSDFIYGPATTLRYARSFISFKPIHYLGHNPLGGWMVVALLLCLIGVCWSGLEAYGEQGHGPLAQHQTWVVSPAVANGHERERRSERGRKPEKDEFWKEIHEALSNLALFIVFLHVVGGALIGSAIHRENLIKAMITGYKTRRAP
jgi:cytochrome b